MITHWPELVIVLLIALVVFGPKRLPEIGSSLGKGIREFKRGTAELPDSLRNESPVVDHVENETVAAPRTPPEDVRQEADREVSHNT
ncbi:MAG: Sec-independent protein translocase subunit TatA/TatB [Chloroflexota bacterium]